MILNQMFADQQIGFPVLSAMIFLPVLVALLLTIISNEETQRKVTFFGMMLNLAMAIVVVYKFVPGVSDMQFAEQGNWMSGLGSSYHLGVDGISVLFLPLTALLAVLVLLFSWNSVKFFNRFFLVNLLILEAATIGIFCSIDLILFFVFWEMALIPSFFLIKFWGVGAQRQYAGMKYIVYMLFGSAPLLISFLLVGWNYSNVAELTPGMQPYSFDLLTLLNTPIPLELQTTIFILMAIGFAVKGPMMPFHTWLPTTIMEGPIGFGVFLVGLKLGVYGMLRFVIPLLPDAAKEWYMVMVILGLLALLYGAVIALVQPNMRRLLAFASVSHVGLAMVGLFSLNQQGMQGAVFTLINMGLTSTGLLFIAGFIYSRLGSTELSAMGGLTRHLPRMAAFCFIIGLASIGMPGTSGFNGEFLVMLGSYRAHWAFSAVAVLGVVLSASYFLWYYERSFFGPVTSKVLPKLKDLAPREITVAATLTVIILALGFNPAPVANITSGSVAAVVQRLNDGSAVKVAQPAALPPAVEPAAKLEVVAPKVAG